MTHVLIRIRFEGKRAHWSLAWAQQDMFSVEKQIDENGSARKPLRPSSYAWTQWAKRNVHMKDHRFKWDRIEKISMTDRGVTFLMSVEKA